MRFIFSTILLCVSGVAFADAEMTFNDGAVGLISDGKVLFGDTDSSVLFEDGNEYFIVINPKKQTYMRVDKGFADQMKSQVNAEMERMLANMPERQRETAKQQMKAMMPQRQEERTTSARRTGESDEVANFDCEIAEMVYDDGTVESVVCVAAHDELGLSSADYRTLSGAMMAMQEMAAMGGGGSAENDFDKLGGIPIRSSGKHHNSELVSLDVSSVDKERMKIPENFTEVSVQDMMRR